VMNQRSAVFTTTTNAPCASSCLAAAKASRMSELRLRASRSALRQRAEMGERHSRAPHSPNLRPLAHPQRHPPRLCLVVESFCGFRPEIPDRLVQSASKSRDIVLCLLQALWSVRSDIPCQQCGSRLGRLCHSVSDNVAQPETG
jgi:hypothetical protein